MTVVRYRLLSPSAKAPERMTDGAAGFDLYASDAEALYLPGVSALRRPVRFHTGVAFEIPEGFVGLVFPRSSVCRTSMRLSNCVGVIDSDYRGEVSLVFDRTQTGREAYRAGDRVGQIVFVKLPEVELEQAEELSETERGDGGYGSTGR